MDLLRTINRRHFCIITAAVVLGLTIFGFGGAILPHKKSPVYGSGDITNLCMPGTPLYDLLYSGQNDDPFSALSYPFQKELLRGILASRAVNPRDFKDVLASYSIDLRSDPDELENIDLASEGIDGVVIQPYEVFSFNSTVGPRTENRGFRPGLMFQQGEVITGVGGGVCIVSTALYNAAAETGLKILDRGPHSGPVRYADPGMDAAVVYGCKDMVFKNDWPTPIMIRSQIEDGKLTVSLMGKKRPGFTVDIVQKEYKELPFKLVESEDSTIPEGTFKVKVPARTGFDVIVVRLIKQDGKLVQREVLSHDHIAPRDKVVLIPPKPKVTAPVVATKPEKPWANPTAIPAAAEPKMQEAPAATAQPSNSSGDASLDVKLGIPRSAAGHE